MEFPQISVPGQETVESMEERVVLPALRYQGKIYTGLNHGLAYAELQDKHPDVQCGEAGGVEEGFTTTLHPFVDRITAKSVAIVAGQTQQNNRDELYSEDLNLLR